MEATTAQEGGHVARALTDRQRQVLEYLVSEIKKKGYAPSVREIGLALGLRSPSTVHQHLIALEQKGCIRRHGERMRALEIVDKSLVHDGDGIVLPLVGRVSAGRPILADGQPEECVVMPPRFFGDIRGCFLLRVRGDSMIGAGILPGDLVLVRPQAHAAPGDIVVALLGEDATVKRLSIAEGTPVLAPENTAYQPIRDEFQIIGRVLGTIRAYEQVRGWA
jgi:repressor LexA